MNDIAEFSKSEVKKTGFVCYYRRRCYAYYWLADRAAEIAVQTVRDFLAKDTSVKRVVFNVFKDLDLAIYEELLTE